MRVSEKTTENSERLGWQAQQGIERGTSRLSALNTEPLYHFWGTHRSRTPMNCFWLEAVLGGLFRLLLNIAQWKFILFIRRISIRFSAKKIGCNQILELSFAKMFSFLALLELFFKSLKWAKIYRKSKVIRKQIFRFFYTLRS